MNLTCCNEGLHHYELSSTCQKRYPCALPFTLCIGSLSFFHGPPTKEFSVPYWQVFAMSVGAAKHTSYCNVRTITSFQLLEAL